jgi:hypothetical protein
VLLLGVWAGLGHATSALAAELTPRTVEAWERYAEATEQRIARELASDRGFLVRDFDPDAARTSRQLLSGDIEVEEMRSLDASGVSIDVPKGLIHHWRGAVFIPGASVEEILRRVSDPEAEDLAQQDVLESRVLERHPDSLRLFLKLHRKQFVTAVYNTEHAVRFTTHGKGRASSRSISTRIAEVDEAQTPDEREKPVGDDRGFLWRLNSYWRYQQVDGGVIVECESISLSRSIPGVLRVMVRPLINSTASGSMTRTLSSMRDRYRTPDATRLAARHDDARSRHLNQD